MFAKASYLHGQFKPTMPPSNTGGTQTPSISNVALLLKAARQRSDEKLVWRLVWEWYIVAMSGVNAAVFHTDVTNYILKTLDG